MPGRRHGKGTLRAHVVAQRDGAAGRKSLSQRQRIAEGADRARARFGREQQVAPVDLHLIARTMQRRLHRRTDKHGLDVASAMPPPHHLGLGRPDGPVAAPVEIGLDTVRLAVHRARVDVDKGDGPAQQFDVVWQSRGGEAQHQLDPGRLKGIGGFERGHLAARLLHGRDVAAGSRHQPHEAVSDAIDADKTAHRLVLAGPVRGPGVGEPVGDRPHAHEGVDDNQRGRGRAAGFRIGHGGNSSYQPARRSGRGSTVKAMRSQSLCNRSQRVSSMSRRSHRLVVSEGSATRS
jgi:hypothetical protein